MKIKGYFAIWSASDYEWSEGPTIIYKETEPTEKEMERMNCGVFNFSEFQQEYPGWRELHDIIDSVMPDRDYIELEITIKRPEERL